MTILIFVSILLRIIAHYVIFVFLVILDIPLFSGYELVILVKASVSYFFSNITIHYIGKLLLRNLVFRLVIFVIVSIVLFNGYVSGLVINTIVEVLLLFYYFYIIISRPNNIPLVYIIVSLSITLSFIALVTWGISYGLLLLLDNSSTFSFDFLLMSDNNPSSPEGNSGGSGENSGGSGENSGGSGGSSPNNDNNENEIDENDVPELHGLRATCQHLTCFPASDLESLEYREDIPCDFNPIYQGPDMPLESHSAFPPEGSLPIICGNCSAIICHDCANNLNYDSGASLGSTPPINDNNSNNSDS